MNKSNKLFEVGRIISTVECLIVRNGRALLLKRPDTAKKFPGWYIGPGGHVDETEDYLSAAIREVREETGITVSDSEIRLRAVGIGRHPDRGEIYVVCFFLVTPDTDRTVTHSGEGVSEWIEVDKLAAMTNIFPPFAHYIGHALGNSPGILYTNLKFENLTVAEISSSRTGRY